ncbi:TrkA family potassium uptake protein [Deferribacter autotrophicus]|uniref:TrkA family potassium uptake protein n=1 Tax=Deferribacter autotrophicus TaxID=500465 RepID=A0A5A8F259_9BACT|nr:TrkA family potassium uptake protein [Deferribacter autotrophicus]KAA0258042.1 TrkA family potassium uptake protein [Deferribacter autotrophicus]
MFEKSRDVLVMGLGIFGYEVAVSLAKEGINVLAVDKNTKVINQIKDIVTDALVADAANEEALKELSVDKYDAVILGMSSSFESLILCITYLKKLGAKYIIAKASTAIQKEILMKIGADEVILPEKEIALKLAEKIARPNIIDFFELGGDAAVATVKVPSKFYNKSLMEIDLRKKYNITAIILIRDGSAKLIRDASIKLMENDELVVAGEEDNIKKVFSE